MAKIQFTPRFVNTRNVNNFAATMDALMFSRGGRGDGDERLGCVHGQAGRGKTRTVQTWAARHNAVYLETAIVWSELDFLQALCRELGVRKPAGRRGKAFADAIDVLLINPRPVFIDEIERFGQRMLEVVRDLAKITGGVFVLIGEEELPHLMKLNRRMWSRTYQAMEFEPASPADIVAFVKDTAGLKLTAEAMKVMHQASGGDLRIIRRDTINLVHVVNSMARTGEVSGETARIACKSGLSV
jgi:DNA transposition AAA+ family ATPase